MIFTLSSAARSRIALALALTAVSGCSIGTAGQGGGFSPAAPSHASQAKGTAVPCSRLQTLRGLHRNLREVTNSKTGDTLEYLVLGDGTAGKDVLVMFPGTGQILPDWPVQMITNSTFSPKIERNPGYRRSEDGPVSLCHKYRMVLFDYPGVGKTPLKGSVTRDMIASDVDALLTDVTASFGIATDAVDPVGWSLGTTNALKFSFLSPAARPARTIHNLVLIATGPGGSVQGDTGGADSAACVTTLFDASLSATGALGRQIKGDLSKSIFPYRGQGPHDNGTKSGCTATVSSTSVTLSVQLECTLANNCKAFLDSSLANIATYPWSLTKGIDDAVYAQQRELSNDWDIAYCARAGQDFTSQRCSSFGTVQMSDTNGGVCKTDTKNRDHPVASSCVTLRMSGKMTVINGYEDLLDQWTYGKALVDGYNRSQGPNFASLRTYAGSAGHGVLIQHPGWTQLQVERALQL